MAFNMTPAPGKMRSGSAEFLRKTVDADTISPAPMTTLKTATTATTTTTLRKTQRKICGVVDVKWRRLLFVFALSALLAGGETKMESECSHSHFIRALPLGCEKGTKIKILGAFYGWWFANRQDHGCSFRPGDCTRNTTQPRRCNGKQNCLVKVEYGFSRWGPCDPSMHDYLQVHYECIPVIPASNPSKSLKGDSRSVVTETYGPRIGTEHAIAAAIGIALLMLIVVVISWYIMKYQRHKRRSDSDADSQSDEDDGDFRPDLFPSHHHQISPSGRPETRRPRREVALGRRGRILAPSSSSLSRASTSRYICAPSGPQGGPVEADGLGFACAISPSGERTVTVDNYYNNFHEKTATVTYKVATRNCIANPHGNQRNAHNGVAGNRTRYAHHAQNGMGGQNNL